MPNQKIRAAIIGATGYTGSELVRLLIHHPNVDIVSITSESYAGKPFSAVHPQYAGLVDVTLSSVADLDASQIDVAFLALPHGVSMDFVKQYREADFKIVDLSGDFRLETAEVYEEWYGKSHAVPELIAEAAFGLPEWNREAIQKARLVANPGCYPTASSLAVAALVAEGLLEDAPIIVDAKSGVTGAGAKAKPNTHFPDVFGDFKAYGLLKHRHTPEIAQVLSRAAGKAVTVLFTPHLLPIDRGILATTYSKAKAGVTQQDLDAAMQKHYGDEPFVRLMPDRIPGVKQVRGSNYCDIHWALDERTGTVVTVSVIDNLVKGAAGQAVQNVNLMFGFPETAGLTGLPLAP